MTMRQRVYGKKGLIFALDGALAVTVVVLMVINSTYYFSLAGKSSLSHLQSVKIGDDIITMMDYLGHLDNTVINNSAMPAGNTFEISDQLLNVSKFLPANYDMWISVSDLKESIVSSCSGSPSVVTLALERPMNATVQ